MNARAWAWRGAWRAGSLGVAALFVALWQAAADHHLVSPVFLPGPDRAWLALERGLTSGRLTGPIVATCERMLVGWVLASIIGIGLGALIGTSAALRRWIGPMLEFLRPLPASALVPLAIALFGLSEPMVLGVIAFGALWPMLLSTVQGFGAVEPRLYEVARALGLSRGAVIARIALPSALPDILAGLRLGLTVALILAVVGEILTGRTGLGQWVLLAARSFRSPDLYAGVIVLGVIGLVSTAALSLVEARALRWRG